MSVAGIFGSNLFSQLGSQIGSQLGQKSGATASSGAQSAFAAVQQGLSGSGSGSTAGTSSIPGQLSQLGQDLKSGNLTAAQSDFSTFKMSLAQAQTQMLRHFQSGSSSSGSGGASSSGIAAGILTGSAGASGQSGTASDPLTAAMLAYSSLQQNPTNSGLSGSRMTPNSTFAINA